MTLHKYFTKDTLIEAAREGNAVGYNRQLDPEALADLEYRDFLPITFTLPHEHIAEVAVTPHMRVMVKVGPEDTDRVLFDLSTERYNGLPALDTEDILGHQEDGQHRHVKGLT